MAMVGSWLGPVCDFGGCGCVAVVAVVAMLQLQLWLLLLQTPAVAACMCRWKVCDNRYAGGVGGTVVSWCNGKAGYFGGAR